MIEQQKQNYKKAGRLASVAVLVLIMSVLQNTPGWFPSFFGAKAYLLIPSVVSVAIFEKDIGGIFFGLFAGALWDICASGSDYYAIFLVVAGFVCGSLLNNIMRPNILTNLLLSAVWTAVFCVGHWILRYIVGGLDNSVHALITYYLPSFIWTVALSPVIFLIVAAVENAFMHDFSVHADLDREN
ncbi:MAG: hypothetical protein IKH13_09560 [Clostridia bacterium]|nr:hypothetical protein [Clostridia bacterium]